MPEKEKENLREYDCCVLCRVKTDYPKNIPIHERFGYIEGAGQLCPDCYRKLYAGKPEYHG